MLELNQSLMTINQRIEHLIIILGLNPNSFSDKINLSRQTIHGIIGPKQSKPGFEILNKITTAFPVNESWLLKGEGEPIKIPDSIMMINESTVEYKTLTKFEKTLSKEQIELFEEYKKNYLGSINENKVLKKKIKELNNLIDSLAVKVKQI